MKRALVLVTSMLLASTAMADDRIGGGDEFTALEGWTVTGESFASMRAEGGVAVFETHILNLPAQMDGKEVCSRTFLDLFKPGTPLVKYGGPHVGYKAGVAKDLGVIDLDKFHWLVMKIDQRPMGAELELALEDANGRKSNVPVQVAASSGILAQDLAPLGAKGRQKVRLVLEIFNTGRELKIDYIRLVSQLTPEEQAGLIGAPVTLPGEKIARHPYQKLEALWQRAPRPWANLPASAEEQALFRDVGTAMPTWRLTATPAHEGLKGANLGWIWRADGSSISTPVRTFYFADARWGKEGQRYWQDLAAKAASPYSIGYDKPSGKWLFKKRDEKGAYNTIYEHTPTPGRTTTGSETGIFGNRLVAGIIGNEVVVVDVDPLTGKPAVKVWPLPPIDSKGGFCTATTLSYWCPFLSMHRINIDLDTGVIREDGVHQTMTHGMSGPDYSIMSYDGVSKVVLSPAGKNSATPGKEITVYGPYKGEVSTDYGEMTPDSRYGVTNGLKGELANQYVLFDRLDAGTVLRLATYNVSYETWDLRAKEELSPDYTKIAYASDYLGDADIFWTVVRRPTAPREVKATREAAGVKVTWTLPEPRKEIMGYDVYRSTKSGGVFTKLTAKPVAGAEFVDANAPAGGLFYLVTSVEPSGLVSVFSNEARVDAANAPAIVHLEAEDAEYKDRPMRDVVDGLASGFRVVRVTKVRETDGTGKVVFRTHAPRRGDYVIWARCRGEGVFDARGETTARISVASDSLVWARTDETVSLTPEDTLLLESAEAGVAVDKIIVTDDKDYVPKTADDRKAPPAAPANLRATKTTANSVELAWDAVADPDLYCYSVYVGDKPDFVPGNESILCSTRKTTALDWGIKPGTTRFYKVVAIDRFGNESASSAVETKTAELISFTAKLTAVAPGGGKLLNGKDASGVSYVEYPGPDAGEQSLTFDFEVPVDGAYYVWLQYTPTFNKAAEYDNMGFQFDGGKLRTMSTRPRAPRGQKGPGRWFVERLASEEKLAAGKHAITLALRNKDGVRMSMGQRIAAMWVTNDASFVPGDYTAQVMFDKPTPWVRK